MSPAVSRLAAYMVNRLENVVKAAEWERDSYKDRAERAEQREQEARLQSGGGWSSPHTKRVNAIVNMVDRGATNYRSGFPYLSSSDLTDQDIADGILDLARSRSLADDVRRNIDRTINDVTLALDPFRHTLKQLETLKAAAKDMDQRALNKQSAPAETNIEAVPTGAASVIQGEK